MAKKHLYLVETFSTFRHRYVVEASSQDAAENAVRSERVEEWQQKHLGEEIIATKVVTPKTLTTGVYRKDNQHDGSPWIPLQRFIHKDK